MVIWGWSPELYVETGLVHATSESTPAYQVYPNQQQAYFVQRWASELRRSDTRVFVDSQIPGNLSYEFLGERGQRYDEFPEIAKLVEQDFVKVSEVAGVAIYVRR